MSVHTLKGKELDPYVELDPVDSIRADLAKMYNSYFAGAVGMYTDINQLEDRLHLVKNLNRVVTISNHEELTDGGYVG